MSTKAKFLRVKPRTYQLLVTQAQGYHETMDSIIRRLLKTASGKSKAKAGVSN